MKVSEVEAERGEQEGDQVDSCPVAGECLLSFLWEEGDLRLAECQMAGGVPQPMVQIPERCNAERILRPTSLHSTSSPPLPTTLTDRPESCLGSSLAAIKTNSEVLKAIFNELSRPPVEASSALFAKSVVAKVYNFGTSHWGSSLRHEIAAH
jgi:hypothetical protein